MALSTPLQLPSCERKPTLTDAENFPLLHSACDPTACFVQKLCEDEHCRSALAHTVAAKPTTATTQSNIGDSLPCCSEYLCDFDLHSNLCLLTTTACLDPSPCFTFPCLDEACLDYASTPCQEPGCPETTATECDDPDCEDSIDCQQCLKGPQQTCTTCCMADVCPNPAHAHLPRHHHSPAPPSGYMPWVPQLAQYAYHSHSSPCSSTRSSVEPRLSAALKGNYGIFEPSPITTDTQSISGATDSMPTDTIHRGGHRRLQGAAARQPDGTYMCHWHTSGDVFSCDQTFADAQGLHEHIQSTHFNGSSAHHPCLWSGCDSGAFNTKPKLARHLHSHTEFKPHKCDYPGCGLGFVTQQQRDVHKKKHTGEKPFTCDECGKAFAYMDLLKSHLRSGVHGKPEKKFVCLVCGEGFSDSSNRTKHTKSVHDPLTGVPCPHPGCCYIDTRREKLRLHCEMTGHASALASHSRDWEDFFTNEQSLRKPYKVKRNKRSAVHAGFDPF